MTWRRDRRSETSGSDNEENDRQTEKKRKETKRQQTESTYVGEGEGRWDSFSPVPQGAIKDRVESRWGVLVVCWQVGWTGGDITVVTG